MADIVYRYPEMELAAVDVDNYAEEYKKAAETLETEILSVISNWEGESKDKFVAFLTGTVKEYIHENIPQVVRIISAEIRQSAEYMSKTDSQLADNISKTSG